jgi:hypothetical protein
VSCGDCDTADDEMVAGVNLADGAWVHLACAVWTPEVQFENPAELQGIRLDDLTADRTELRCGICKQVGRLGECFGQLSKEILRASAKPGPDQGDPLPVCSAPATVTVMPDSLAEGLQCRRNLC